MQDIAAIAAGWIFVIHVADASSADLFRPFPTAIELDSVYLRYTAASGLPPGVSLLLTARMAEFAVITAALNTSDSLSRQSFRDAILSLNSQTIQG